MRNLLAVPLIGLLLAFSACAQAQTTQCVTNAQAGGTPDAITIPLLPCGLATNLLILTLSGANTVSAPTIQMQGFAAQTIKNATGNPLAVGALPGSGAVVLLTSLGTEWRLLSNGTGASSGASGLTTVATYTDTTPVTLPTTPQITVIANTAGAATSVVLPASSNWPDCPTLASTCPEYVVKNGTGASVDGTVTVTAADSKTIDGYSSYALLYSQQSATFFLEGTRWGVK